MNKYYIRGSAKWGNYTAHDFKVGKLKKSRRKTAKASKRKNRSR